MILIIIWRITILWHAICEIRNALKKDKFDIIISDLRLPGVNGLELLRSAIKFQPGILGVLITAYSDRDIASKASEIGVHDFIEKPFLVGTLVESLAGLIKSRKDA